MSSAVHDKRPAMQNGNGNGVGVQPGVIGGDGTRAPFPWYGGKRRWSDRISERLGTVGVYGEPCMGSFAVGLTRAPAPREIATDTDALLVNAYRGIRTAPDETAWYASYPTFHHDLTARQPWLIEWRRQNGDRVCEDPDWCDPKAAGWWVWGASNWIGGGWCQDDPRSAGKRGQRPRVEHKGASGNGVSAQRCDGQIPRVADDGRGGQGVQAQRAMGQIPKLIPNPGGSGVQPQALTDGGEGDILDGTRWQPWFRALAKRLERVVLLNRGWQSAVTPSMLQHTPSGPKPTVGLFFDPPYRTRDNDGEAVRDGAIYHGDEDADDVAHACYEWAVEHGEKFRIAYACRAGDFDVPKGWTSEVDSFAGVRDQERREKHQDMLMFSPACVGQMELF